MKSYLTVVLALVGGLVLAANANAPSVPLRTLELPPRAGNPRNSEGDFARLNDGSILHVYSHFTKGKGADDDPACLMSRLSRDGGLTWTRDDVCVVPSSDAGDRNVMSTSFLRLKDGCLGLFYLRKNSPKDCRPVLRVSRDEGRTWGEAAYCVPEREPGYYVLNNCRAVRLSSGRILLPLCQHDTADGKAYDWAGRLVCYFSDDDGRTWTRGRGCFKTYDEKGARVTTQEPGAIELKDGRVLMYARTNRGRQWFYHSSDGGDTWTKGEPGSLVGPCSPALLRRLANGDLLAVWNDHETAPHMDHPKRRGRRRPFTLAVSQDEGRTWIHRKTIENEDDGWYCYPAALELDGSVLLAYCAEKMLCHSRVMRVPLAWLYTDMTPVPDLFGGDAAMTAGKWEKVRRPQLLETFTREEFGRRPVERPPVQTFTRLAPDEEVYDGLGLKRRMRMTCGNGRGGSFDVLFTAYLPKAKKPAPAFLLITPHDPDRVGERVNERRPHRMAVRELLERGYAGVSYKNDDCAVDQAEGIPMTNGVFAVFGPLGQATRAGDSWGAISAWAWGASRVMDWIATQPEIDSARVAVVGLSRCGKTALWAGATDTRFACAISCCSGAGGAKLDRMNLPCSESLERINRFFPHWFAPNYARYSWREGEQAFDHHELVALMAPRLCIVASATEDWWAGPQGEFESARLASPAWELYGRRGLVGDVFPPPATALNDGCVAYQYRVGLHDQRSWNWQRYMDFLDARWGAPRRRDP